MTPPALHPKAQIALESLASDLPQSLLLSGEDGVGLLTIAQWLGDSEHASILYPQNIKEQRDDSGGTIRVEMIRRLYEQTRAKRSTRQIIIIDNADRMSTSAQAAFLKLLEEPRHHVHFILTSHRPSVLLPTVRSRVQHFVVQPLTSQASEEFVVALGVIASTRQAQLSFLASGLPAELTRLVYDEAYFLERATIMSDARTLLQANIYEKLRIIQKYRADRTQALQCIDSALRILRRTMSAKPQQPLVAQLEQLLDLRARIDANQNIPLQLALYVL
jgi:DNA polymerase-3 subunit delta'